MPITYHYGIRVPEDWNIELLKQHYATPVGHERPRSLPHKAHELQKLFERSSWLLSFICDLSLRHRNHDSLQFPVLELSSHYLGNMATDDYRRILDFFLELGILVAPRGSSYSNSGDKFCKAYQLTHQLSPSLVEMRLTNYVVRKSFRRLRKEWLKNKRKQSKKVMKKYAFLSPLKDGRVTIEVEPALQHLKDVIIPKLSDRLKNSKRAMGYYKHHLPEQIRQFNDEVKTDIKQDNYGGRVYTPVTQLHGELRQFIRLDGQPLVQLDIKCSHPFHLGAAVLKDVKKLKDLASSGLTPSSVHSSSSPLMYPKCPESLDVIESEALDFLAKTNGIGGQDLYEAFAEAHSKNLNRTQAKKGVQLIINDDLKSNKGYINEHIQAFSSGWPMLYSLIEEAKIKDNKAIGRWLSTLEREMLLDRIANALHAQGIKVLTIHDAAMFHMPVQDKVEDIVRQGYQAEFDCSPRLT